jgi:hypothetical protein
MIGNILYGAKLGLLGLLFCLVWSGIITLLQNLAHTRPYLALGLTALALMGLCGLLGGILGRAE